MGFIKPTEGNIDINSLDAWAKSSLIKDFTGYLPGELAFNNNNSLKDYINFLKIFKNDYYEEEYLNKLATFFELDTNIKLKSMSKGMKQKLAIICSVLFKPKLLILDEPTTGLDPIMQEKFNQLILRLKKEGVTIILCSHIFSEVSKLCDVVGFIKNGKLLEENQIKDWDLKELEKHFLSLYETKGEF
ncbi:ABC transporter ATP-binding protein [Spiroplasma gladiatoris]|uniref:ABC transporter ATP-binding protein n=1 Tax=Spiroplasma gladiatoris TaxID=2143 RepID=A0A4P7AIU9_9MOLU|nr:ATP-binding cassette domain-containing protein [Spiroplasma gladiatoris]QBQ07653.1 ABC transporter ATP-binding protein [Spiroplasma gladiatoris]